MLGKFEELLVILVVILVLFGDNKLPELARGLAKSMRGASEGNIGGHKDEAGKHKK